MKTNARVRLLASTLLMGAGFVATSAQAQVIAQDQAVEQTNADGSPVTTETSQGDIVVTGTLIRNPNLVSSSPVAVVGREELTLRQTNTAEEVLRQLPGAVPSIGTAVNNGNGGASFVNLRNLGSNRNLVLLDGKRIATAGLAGQTDLNNIPLALLERMDVLTGGASTTYGADAVSGVVNFVTRSDFAGVDASASQQISQRGDGNYFRADLTIGANFDDGRGNAVFSVGYQEADPIYQGDRPYASSTISSTTGRAAGGSPTSVPASFGLAGQSALLQIDPNNTSLVPAYQDFNFSPYNIFFTPFKRYNMYGAGHYDVSDTVTLYTRGLFSKNRVSTIIAPSGIFAESLTVPGNNPYLPAGIRDQFCSAAGIALGTACNTNAAIPMPEVYRRTVEVGPRISEYQTTLFDYTAGIRLNMTKSLVLDVYGSYGESENVQTQSGYVLKSRVQQALNATNTTSCLNTANGCVPLNLFGQAGSISAAQAGFLNGQSTVTNKTQLSQAHALLSGDFGFTSPAASTPISFAAGAEYRDYRAQRIPDAYALVPGELGGAGGAVLPVNGGFNVTEFFGEIIAPLVEDKPFFQSLTVEGGIRQSRYKIDAAGNPSFNATTWKAGGSWEPITDLKLRGNYQRAVRAPNVSELFDPVSTYLVNLTVDPCAGAGPTTNANLRAICVAQGAPAAVIGSILSPASGQPNATGGGNPNIRPEVADTFTVGAILTPRTLVEGLTISVDYFNIKVNQAITAATPADILAACFGNITAASATSTACTSIRRSTATGRLSGSTATVAGLPQPLTNLGRIATDGIDLGVDYRRDLGFAKLNLNFQGTWTNSNTFQASPSSVVRECVGYYSANCLTIQPKFAWNQRTTLTFGDVDLSLLWRHIDTVRYEPGLTPLFSGAITGNTPIAGQNWNFNRIKAYNYLDLGTRIRAAENFEFTILVTNLLDKQPPIVGSNAGSTSYNSGNTYPSTYDAVGRGFRVGARVHF
ncbi:TonB-dependent receptor domain-containing protein [Sphingomonas pseudosanguinis]|uniref:TonB-dependent receptor domain-containing protein n=1 Tax=Sphingomonas pseudosanguinis TaxID=413712 RepID=UPI003F8503BF